MTEKYRFFIFSLHFLRLFDLKKVISRPMPDMNNECHDPDFYYRPIRLNRAKILALTDSLEKKLARILNFFPVSVILARKKLKNSDHSMIVSNLKSLKMTINAPGRQVTDTFSRLICIDRDNFEEEVSLPVDPNFYEGSRRVEFGAIGDVLGPAVSRTGCESKKIEG